MKKVLPLIAVFLCMGLTACGGSAVPAPEPEPAPAPAPVTPAENPAPENSVPENPASPVEEDADGTDNSLQNVLDKGEFIMGLETSFAPMGALDESGEIVGFDVDLAQEVCDRLGITLIKQPIIWDEKEDDLALGKIDCIWSGMSVTPQRERDMCLTEPYMHNHIVFVVAADSGVTVAEEMDGKTIGVQNGSTSEDLLNLEYEGKVFITAMESNDEAFRQLELGFSDAVCIDSVVADYWIATQAQGEYITVPATSEVDEYAIGFRKNDKTLCEAFQKTLDEMQDDGSFAEISTKWFGANVSLKAGNEEISSDDGNSGSSPEENAGNSDEDSAPEESDNVSDDENAPVE